MKAIEQAAIALEEKKEVREAVKQLREDEEKVPECVVCAKSGISDPPSPTDSACFYLVYCRQAMHKECGTPCHENAMEAYCTEESCKEAETKWIANKKQRIE